MEDDLRNLLDMWLKTVHLAFSIKPFNDQKNASSFAFRHATAHGLRLPTCPPALQVFPFLVIKTK